MKKEKSQWTLQKYKKTLSKYYEQVHANKIDYLEEMDNFLETYSLPKLNQEIDHFNRLITRNEIEYVIKTLPTYKSSGPNGFTGELYQTYKKEEILPILLKLFQKVEEKGTLPKTFYEANITLISKPKIPPKKKIIGQYL